MVIGSGSKGGDRPGEIGYIKRPLRPARHRLWPPQSPRCRAPNRAMHSPRESIPPQWILIQLSETG